MLSFTGVAKLSDSVSRPTLGFVFVIPPVWQAPQVALNKRLPRFTCSGVKTVVFPALSTSTVRVASSKSIAEAVVTTMLKILNKINVKN